MSRRILLGMITAVALGTLAHGAASNEGGVVRVGSKNFNEGYILSEVISQLLESHGRFLSSMWTGFRCVNSQRASTARTR